MREKTVNKIKQFFSQLENDLTSPSISTLCDILSALGTDLSEFFKKEVNEKIVFSAEDFIEKHEIVLLKNWAVWKSTKISR